MKRYTIVFAAISVLALVGAEPAFAAKKRNRAGTDRIQTTQSARASAGQAGSWGLGLSTIGGGASVLPVSAMFNFGGQHSVQALLSLPSTSGGFNFRTGGIYRNAAVGTQAEGLHIGGGFLLGVDANGGTGGTSAFITQITGVVGPHFTVGESVTFTADAGPVLTINDGSASFSLGALSTQLGLSLHYMF